MACPAILTGDQFLTRVLGTIDCQAQLLGSYGYQTLGEPGSLAATAITGLLTIFIALFGIRLLFGPAPSGRDIVYDILKIGIVLTLAFSWPAFRTVIHDVVLKAPAEIAATIGVNEAAQAQGNLVTRLQNADNAMVRLTEAGAGRNTGAFVDAQQPGGTFAGSALEDESSFGTARLVWLSGVIGSLALLRIIAGLLLALAPLAAGLLLFEATRGLFAGWLKGLVLAMIGSLGATVVLAVEMTILEPWLADALRLRTLGYATPAAPIELFALTLAFALVQFGIIFLLAKVAFHRGWPTPAFAYPASSSGSWSRTPLTPTGNSQAVSINRAQRISDSVATLIRREERTGSGRTDYRSLAAPRLNQASSSEVSRVSATAAPERLGSSYRRRNHSIGQRTSGAGTRRDSST